VSLNIELDHCAALKRIFILRVLKTDKGRRGIIVYPRISLETWPDCRCRRHHHCIFTNSIHVQRRVRNRTRATWIKGKSSHHFRANYNLALCCHCMALFPWRRNFPTRFPLHPGARFLESPGNFSCPNSQLWNCNPLVWKADVFTCFRCKKNQEACEPWWLRTSRRCKDMKGIVAPELGPKSFGTFEKQASGYK